MTTPLYKLNNVICQYGDSIIALDAIDCSIDSGSSLALLGCNGAGKSTLLQVLAGLLPPKSGAVEWNGEELSAKRLHHDPAFRTRFRKSVGIVFQDPDAQWLCDTVKDEVCYGPLQIWDRDETETRVSQLMAVMGINHLADRPPYTLSGGQKRRVALASVIAMDPDVLLLDEPTASLDAATTDFLVDCLGEYVRRPAKTLIVATHDLDLVREITTTSLVLTPCHKTAAHAPTAEILNDHNLLRQMNLIRQPGRLTSRDSAPA